MFATMTPPS
jgi:septal ring factor EnvC (AmiA/AmiB activator)